MIFTLLVLDVIPDVEGDPDAAIGMLSITS